MKKITLAGIQSAPSAAKATHPTVTTDDVEFNTLNTDLTSDLAKRLAQHDGCSRFGTVDLALLEAVRLTRTALVKDAGTGYTDKPDVHYTVTGPALTAAIDEAKAALVGDSNDAEHDALASLMLALGESLAPECKCEEEEWNGDGHAPTCPCAAWEAE